MADEKLARKGSTAPLRREHQTHPILTAEMDDSLGNVKVVVAIVAEDGNVPYPVSGTFSEHEGLSGMPVSITHRQVAREIGNLLEKDRKDSDKKLVEKLKGIKGGVVTIGPWSTRVKRKKIVTINEEILQALGVDPSTIEDARITVKTAVTAESLAGAGVPADVIEAATETNYGPQYLEVRKAKDAPAKALKEGD